MSSDPDHHGESAGSYVRRLLGQAWRDTRSVYYANTPIWRVLKSGGLLVLGLFCWSASSLLLSYQPGWTVLWYVVAYGFVLILWGPLTHLAIVPLIIRMRRTGEHPVIRWVSKHGSKLNLTVFLMIVIVIGTFPVAPMTLDFESPISDESGPDVDAQLECTKSSTDDLITCHLSTDDGIDHVIVTTGGTELVSIEAAPFEFEIREADLESVVGQKQFTVELRDSDGDRLRQYTRTVAMVPEASSHPER